MRIRELFGQQGMVVWIFVSLVVSLLPLVQLHAASGTFSLFVPCDFQGCQVRWSPLQYWQPFSFRSHTTITATKAALSDPSERRKQLATQRPLPIVGYADITTTQRFAGWACDPANPDLPLYIHFYAKTGIVSKYLGSTLANKPREKQVAQRCNGNARHGYDVSPEQLRHLNNSATIAGKQVSIFATYTQKPHVGMKRIATVRIPNTPSRPTPPPPPATKKEQILKDLRFAAPIVVNKPTPGKHEEGARFMPFETQGKVQLGIAMEPVWFITQWRSRFDLSQATPRSNADGSVTYENAGKKITFYRDGSFVLGVKGRNEWKGRPGRKQGESWPHFSLSQLLLPIKMVVARPHPALASKAMVDHDQIHYLKDLKKITLSGAYTLQSRTPNPKGYDPKTMAAQDLIVFHVQNRNPRSRNYGDFFYLALVMSDNRRSCQKERAAGDFAGSGKFIYTPDMCTLLGDVRVGKKKTFAIDLLPQLKKGFQKAKEKGYLKGTNFEDLALSSIVIGWEISAAIDAESRYENLRLWYEMPNKQAKTQQLFAPQKQQASIWQSIERLWEWVVSGK